MPGGPKAQVTQTHTQVPGRRTMTPVRLAGLAALLLLTLGLLLTMGHTPWEPV